MIEIQNWDSLLSQYDHDPSVGIKIAKLAGDKNFSTFITVIAANKHVNPHFHKNGDEHYHIISGSGVLKLKNVITGEKDDLNINQNESFVIPENTLHQLINTGTVPLVLMFSCPESHLNSDRYFEG